MFLKHHAVHLLTRYVELNGCRCHVVGSCPICVVIAVGGGSCAETAAAAVAGFRLHALEDVVAKFGVENLAHLAHVNRVGGWYASCLVDGEVEDEVGVVSNALVVEVHEVLGASHLGVFAFVEEPTRTNRHVAFGWNPVCSVGVAVLQRGVVGVAGIHFIASQECPVGGTCLAALVAHPAAAGTAVAEDDGLWLVLEYVGKYFREIVVGAAVDGAHLACAAVVSVAAVGAVEPELKHFAVACGEFFNLLVVVFHIFGCAVYSRVAVPWREIQT